MFGGKGSLDSGVVGGVSAGANKFLGTAVLPVLED